MSAPGGSWVTQEAPFKLVRGVQYACALQLRWPESLATPEQVEARFTTLGFTGVTASKDDGWRVEGTWPLDDQEVTLPAQVVQVWAWAPAEAPTLPAGVDP